MFPRVHPEWGDHNENMGHSVEMMKRVYLSTEVKLSLE